MLAQQKQINQSRLIPRIEPNDLAQRPRSYFLSVCAYF